MLLKKRKIAIKERKKKKSRRTINKIHVRTATANQMKGVQSQKPSSRCFGEDRGAFAQLPQPSFPAIGEQELGRATSTYCMIFLCTLTWFDLDMRAVSGTSYPPSAEQV